MKTTKLDCDNKYMEYSIAATSVLDCANRALPVCRGTYQDSDLLVIRGRKLLCGERQSVADYRNLIEDFDMQTIGHRPSPIAPETVDCPPYSYRWRPYLVGRAADVVLEAARTILEIVKCVPPSKYNIQVYHRRCCEAMAIVCGDGWKDHPGYAIERARQEALLATLAGEQQ